MSRCIGCGRSAGLVEVSVAGPAAETMGVVDDTVVHRIPVCPRCVESSDREVNGLRAEARRLQHRFTYAETSRIMCRRVDRYFRTGKFVPLAKLAVD